ncbi:MAG TPA: type II toxin-antitoxin system prevent-host-death family antitoxin [Gemmatimonadales bacterium]|nr:type II toxin-antitoxin system prevent-host-death family antitoxin [Gemmatimonadales bacterium]
MKKTTRGKKATTTVNLYEAKTRLSELVERAARGEEIVVAKAGRPRARIVALPGVARVREPGGWEGAVWTAADFDEPLPPEVLGAFTGELG